MFHEQTLRRLRLSSDRQGSRVASDVDVSNSAKPPMSDLGVTLQHDEAVLLHFIVLLQLYIRLCTRLNFLGSAQQCSQAVDENLEVVIKHCIVAVARQPKTVTNSQELL